MTEFFIQSPKQLAEFAKAYGLRDSWHEPDEQDIDAHVYGDHLDNAMGPGGLPFKWTGEYEYKWNYSKHRCELNVILDHTEYFEDGSSNQRPVAVVNLADLLSWACKGAVDE